MKFYENFFLSFTYYGHGFYDSISWTTYDLSLSTRIDRSHLDVHPISTMDYYSQHTPQGSKWLSDQVSSQTIAIPLWIAEAPQVKELSTQLQHRVSHRWVDSHPNDFSCWSCSVPLISIKHLHSHFSIFTLSTWDSSIYERKWSMHRSIQISHHLRDDPSIESI